MPDLPKTIWIDTTTLFMTFRRSGTRATGIPRVVIECMLQARADESLSDRVRLCRADAPGGAILEVSWDEIERLMQNAAAAPPRLPGLRDLIRKHTSPATVDSLLRASTALKRLLGTMKNMLKRPGGSGEIAHPFSSGDCWINLGCWWHANLPDLIGQIKAAGTDVRSVVLIHDCMPLAFPEYFPPDQLRLWAERLPGFQDSTDVLLVNSENTGRDAAKLLPKLADRIERIWFGDTFAKPKNPANVDAVLDRLGINRPYVLIVGTIEARKNHALAFRAWRSLIHQGKEPPLLLFAGKWGWKVTDLAEQIRDSGQLGGYLRVVDGPSDTELDALYRGAQFTLFPSLYEGWGLPVRESLSYGKICLAARNSAILEAGEDLADGFESDCSGALVKAMQAYQDEDNRRTREQEIVTRFRPVGWDRAWGDIKRIVETS